MTWVGMPLPWAPPFLKPSTLNSKTCRCGVHRKPSASLDLLPEPEALKFCVFVALVKEAEDPDAKVKELWVYLKVHGT